MKDFLDESYTYDARKSANELFKDDEQSGRVHLYLHMLNSSARKEELGLRHDTYFYSPFEDSLDIFYDLGFKAESVQRFDDEVQILLLHPSGILASVESETIRKRRGDQVLKVLGPSTLYYNWRPHNQEEEEFIQSISYIKYWQYSVNGVYVGSLNAREALRQKMALLENSGEFMAPWKQMPGLDLRNSQQEKTNMPVEEVNKTKLDFLVTQGNLNFLS